MPISYGNTPYTGITKQDLNKRLYQHNYTGKEFEVLRELYNEEFSKNQARALEQYFIENGPANKMNKINSISKTFEYYNDARNWAEEYANTHEMFK